MIVKLTGVVQEHEGDVTVLDVTGVGYGVLVTREEQGRSPVGKTASFYIYEHIRENGYDLFGFSTKNAKNLFELLVSVNGVGPKGALALMNLGNDSSLRAAIAGGDTTFITSASGIGKKVAERIVVDLKNKVGLGTDAGATDFLQDLPENSQDEALQALITLGYTPADAAAALRGIDTALSTEQRVKQALKGQR